MMTTLSFQQQLCLDMARLYTDASDSAVEHDLLAQVGRPPDERTFRVHSVILCARSDYFKTALSKRWAKKEAIYTFEEPSIDAKVFEVILKYIYTGDITLDSSKVCHLDLILTADMLALTDLVDKLQEHLVNKERDWFKKMLIPIYRIGITRETSLTKLVNECKRTILASPNIVFRSDEFVTLDESTIIALFKHDDLRIEEVDLWRCAVNWGFAHMTKPLSWKAQYSQDEVEELADVLKSCIPHIRFFSMSSVNYFKHVRPLKGVLDPDLVEQLEEFYFVPGKLPPRIVKPPRLPCLLFGSSLLHYQQAVEIAKWIDGEDNSSNSNSKSSSSTSPPWNYVFELLYGCNYADNTFDNFHRRCGNRGPTLVIIKVAGMELILGGYNPLNWKASQTYLRTDKAFIFSFTPKSNGHGILSRVREFNKAICDANAESMGIFGFGDMDLPVFGGQVRNKGVYERSVITAQSFVVESIEVFSVSNEVA